MKIGIGLAVIFALGWFASGVTRAPIDCDKGFDLGMKLFFNQGRAIVCTCVPPERRQDVIC